MRDRHARGAALESIERHPVPDGLRRLQSALEDAWDISTLTAAQLDGLRLDVDAPSLASFLVIRRTPRAFNSVSPTRGQASRPSQSRRADRGSEPGAHCRSPARGSTNGSISTMTIFRPGRTKCAATLSTRSATSGPRARRSRSDPTSGASAARSCPRVPSRRRSAGSASLEPRPSVRSERACRSTVGHRCFGTVARTSRSRFPSASRFQVSRGDRSRR